MNKLKLVLQLAFCCVILCHTIACNSTNQIKEKTLISGEITGVEIESFRYTDTSNGRCFMGFLHEATLDDSGRYEIELTVEEPTIIRLYLPMKVDYKLVLEPGKNYDLNFDFSGGEPSAHLKGETKSFHDVYNNFDFPSHISMSAPNYSSNTPPEEIHSVIDKKKNRELSQLNKLLEQKLIPQDVYALITMDRQVYYSALKGLIAYRMSRRRKAMLPNTVQFWKDIFEENPLRDDLMKSPWFPDYMKSYLESTRYSGETYDYNYAMRFEDRSNKYATHVEEINEQLDGELEYYYESIYLYLSGLQRNFDKTLLTLFEEYKKDHKEGDYHEFVEGELNEISRYYSLVDADFSDEVKFLPLPERINSISQVANQLKGKKVFVDVWASWCGPCRREFQFKDEMDVYLKSEGIEVLYLSIDEDKNIDKWEKLIKYHELNGYHLRVNNALKRELALTYAPDGKLRIPWYFMINEKGEIVLDHAARPSQLADLKRQVEKFF